MRRPSPRHPPAAPPSLALPVALAVAALGALAFGRWWIARPQPAAPVALDAGSYLTAVAPLLRRAGCAAPACHGGRARPHLDPSPPAAAALLAELAAVRAAAGAGDPASSPLWLHATRAAHAGGGALAPDGCEARLLARWIAGAVVRSCPAPLPRGGR